MCYLYEFQSKCMRFGKPDIRFKNLGRNSILFNNNKTISIKFGSKVKEGERAILYNSDLLFTGNVVYVGNYINSACTDNVNCSI